MAIRFPYTCAIQALATPGRYADVDDGVEQTESLPGATADDVARDILYSYIHDGDDLTGPRDPDGLRVVVWEGDLTEAGSLRAACNPAAIAYP